MIVSLRARGALPPALFTALLTVSCYRQIDVITPAAPIPARPAIAAAVSGGAAAMRLRGSIGFVTGKFELLDSDRVRVRVPVGTTADFDIVVDLLPAGSGPQGPALSTAVERFAFRWNHAIQVTTAALEDNGSITAPDPWSTVSTVEALTPSDPSAVQTPATKLGRFLASTIARAVVENEGEDFHADRHFVRSVFLDGGEIGGPALPMPVALQLVWPPPGTSGMPSKPASLQGDKR